MIVSDENRATGVRYLHRVHKREGEVRGRTVVVACACVQSVALLLMSTSRRYPNGLANSSGQLGRHFIPHFTGGIECLLEGLAGKPATNDEGFLDHAYLPSFMHTTEARTTLAASAHSSIIRTAGLPGGRRRSTASARPTRRRSRPAYPAFMQFTPYGEMLPNAQSFVDLDRDRTTPSDFRRRGATLQWGANEETLFNDMVRWSLAMLERAGAEILSVPDGPAHQPRARWLPDGPRSASRRSSMPTAARTTCRTCT